MRNLRIGLALLTGALVLAPGSAVAQIPAACAGTDSWVAGLAERVLAYGALGRFAVTRQGAPVTCEGRIESEFDGKQFGSLRVAFSNGMYLAVETFPPEGSVTRLVLESGFADPGVVAAVVRDHTEGFGLRVDWSLPEFSEERGRVVSTYWDPEPGLNASASLVREGPRLVEVRISVAP